jgi:hypothetical protein
MDPTALREPAAPPVAPGVALTPDEAAARRALRTQIARLEAELGDAVVSGFPHLAVDAHEPAARRRRPRVLGLGELEAERDALADRVARARAVLAAHGEEVEANRVLLERMLLHPGRYRFARLHRSEVGMGGCGAYQVRPRLGIIGMLMGWWQVKLSSGCPLAT